MVGTGGAALAAFAALSARLFVWPRQNRPARADAIVVLGGAGDRRPVGAALARAGYAPTLVLSVGDAASDAHVVAPIPGVETMEFRPDPASTQGEAEALAGLAASHGWQRIIVVTGRTQVTRARLRIRRCYRGELLIVPAPEPADRLPYDVVYEWGALLKALVFQRGC